MMTYWSKLSNELLIKSMYEAIFTKCKMLNVNVFYWVKVECWPSLRRQIVLFIVVLCDSSDEQFALTGDFPI